MAAVHTTPFAQQVATKSDKHNPESQDVEQLDTILVRMSKHTPSKPYILSVPSEPPYRIPSSQIGNWRRDTPFEAGEEYLQYQTFLWRDTSDSLLELRSVDEVELMHNKPLHKTEEHRVNGKSTPLQSLVAKKKIKLDAYTSKTKANTQTSTPINGNDSPLTSKPGVRVDQQKASELADEGKSLNSFAVKPAHRNASSVKPQIVVSGPAQMEHELTSSTKSAVSLDKVGESTDAKVKEGTGSRMKEGTGSRAEESIDSKVDTTKSPTETHMLTPKSATDLYAIQQSSTDREGQPRRALANGSQQKYFQKPAKTNTAAMNAQREGQRQIYGESSSMEKTLSRDLPDLLATHEKKLGLPVAFAQINPDKLSASPRLQTPLYVITSTRSDDWVTSSGNPVAMSVPSKRKSSATKRSETKASSFKGRPSDDPPLPPMTRSPAGQGSQPLIDVHSDNGEDEEQLVVKFKYGKSKAKTIDRLLQMRPTPTQDAKSDRSTKRPIEQVSGRDKVEASRSKYPRSPPATDNFDAADGKSATQAPSKSNRDSGTIASRSLYEPPQKREARDSIEQEREVKRARNRSHEVSDPQRTPQSILVSTGKAHEKETKQASSRVASNEVDTPTMISQTPPSSAPHDANTLSSVQGGVVSGSSSHWNGVTNRLLKLGKILKTASAQSRGESPKLAAVQGIESVLCYLLAFTASERAQPSRSGTLEIWHSLLPYAKEVVHKAWDFSDLFGLSQMLLAVACFKISGISISGDIKVGAESTGALAKLLEVTKSMHAACRHAEQRLPSALVSERYTLAARVGSTASPGTIMAPETSVKFAVALLGEYTRQEKLKWIKEVDENICDVVD